MTSCGSRNPPKPPRRLGGGAGGAGHVAAAVGELQVNHRQPRGEPPRESLDVPREKGLLFFLLVPFFGGCKAKPNRNSTF